MASTEIVEKVQKLVALAQSQEKGEATEEARSAAVQVVRLMKENDLVIVPKADLEAAHKAVEGAQLLRKEVKKAKRDGLVMGFIGAQVLGGKGGLF
jgi:hypothetical protein